MRRGLLSSTVRVHRYFGKRGRLVWFNFTAQGSTLLYSIMNSKYCVCSNPKLREMSELIPISKFPRTPSLCSWPMYPLVTICVPRFPYSITPAAHIWYLQPTPDLMMNSNIIFTNYTAYLCPSPRSTNSFAI